jgi:acyl-CoA synthetase (NDP forming)/GNAT superfamily N-acetyltransferase
MSIRNLDALFHPQRLLVLGAPATGSALRLLANARANLPRDRRTLIGARQSGWNCVAADADWPAADVAVLLDEQHARAGTIARLAASGCRALIVATNARGFEGWLVEGRAHNLRVLGPRSAGVATSEPKLNLTTLPLDPLPGSVALIAQSQSVAASALDWAAGRRIGFSWIAVTGGEVDADIGDLLDYAALDPHTRAVVLQVGRIGDGRKFMSAARACGRGKPVVVLQTRSADDAQSSGPDDVRSAAFRRAGLVECESLAGLFDALAALERLPAMLGNRITVIGNGAGVCALGVDALLRGGLVPVEPDAATRERVVAAVPEARVAHGAVDLGPADSGQIVAALKELLAVPSSDSALLIRGPTAEEGHRAAAAAVIAAKLGERLSTVWLGLETALPARALCAEAGIATFTSAEAAARAFGYRWQYRCTQELLMQTPAATATANADAAGIRRELANAVAQGRAQAGKSALRRLLAAYGLATSSRHGLLAPARIRIASHVELGVVVSIQPQVRGMATTCSYSLPPLDNLLVRRALEDAGYRKEPGTEAAIEALVAGVLRLSELIVDQPRIGSLDLQLAVSASGPAWALPDVVLELRAQPPPERRRLALAPYPSEFVHVVAMKGGARYRFRPIKPSDEASLIGLLERVPPEDIRLRFFHPIRHFTHAMAARMTQIDYDRELTMVATPAKQDGRIDGTATLVADPDKARAEFAVLVHQDHAGLGIGRHLLEALLRYAVIAGIGVVYGEVLRENTNMRILARAIGFTEMADPDDPGCVRFEIRPGGELHV